MLDFLLFHSTKDWKDLVFSRIVHKHDKASLLIVYSHFSIRSRRTYTPSMSRKCSSLRLFPKTAFARQSSTELMNVIELPLWSTSLYCKLVIKISIQPALRNIFWFSRWFLVMFERMLIDSSLRFRTPSFLSSEITFSKVGVSVWRSVL